MQNVVLIVHLILALCLIAAVLLQRSEGGALGIGGGGGGGLVSSRGAATALSKLTWALATGFLCTSILLTILAGGGQTGGSVLDRVGQPAGENQQLDQLLPTLPPAAEDDGGAAPGAAVAPPAEPAGGSLPAAPPSAN